MEKHTLHSLAQLIECVSHWQCSGHQKAGAVIACSGVYVELGFNVVQLNTLPVGLASHSVQRVPNHPSGLEERQGVRERGGIGREIDAETCRQRRRLA